MDSKIATLEALVVQLSERVEDLQVHGARVLSGETNIVNLDTGDTAWMLASTALVLFMTIPGLMLYYSGMVRSKNVLATVMQIFSITCLVTCLWLFFGYSLAFAPALPSPVGQDSSPVYGDASRFWLQGMRMDSYHQLAPTIPESVFCAYQLTFAIITPSLICGSFADRMKYVPMLIFMCVWHLIVYCPIAHAVWHPKGFLFKAGALDFAGGNVVHIASGISGLVSSIMLGHRKGFGTEVFHPHNILLTAVGSSMLWVGWYGFNAGSALGANERAGYALLMTQISTATAAMTWLFSEWYMRKQPSVLGMVSGAIAGLVAITPASGFVDPTGAFFIGFIAGPACYFGSQLKHYLGYDDALDGFGVHAIGGALGGVLTGFFATDTIAPGINGVFYASTKVGGTQLGNQIYAIVVCAGWAAFCTFLILQALEMTMGLRVSEETEDKGMDHSLYGESIFDVEYGRRAPIPVRASSPVSSIGADAEAEASTEMVPTASPALDDKAV